MKRDKKFTMRFPPVEPTPGTIKETLSLGESTTVLALLVRHFTDKGFSPEQVSVSVDVETDYDDYAVAALNLFGERPETNEEFDKRLLEYQVESEQYKVWLSENKEAVDAYYEQKEIKNRAKRAEAMAARAKAKERELLAARKRLEALERDMNRLGGGK